MKKITLFTLITISALSAGAQISSLNENFDVSCATATFPSSDGWMVINPVIGTSPLGKWNCTSTNGRPTTLGAPTPGMQCTGSYSAAYHLDTSFFITPLMNLGSYAGGHVYLRFDTKTENIIFGGRLAFAESRNDSFRIPYAVLDTPLLSPAFSVLDSTNWATHQVDLSNYIDSGNIYFSFRYTSTTTSGTIWYLDNIMLTTIGLNVAKVNKDILPFTIIGNSTTSQIALSYTSTQTCTYNIAIFDMVGRRIYDGQVVAHAGTESYTIKGLDLHPGMYCIKMGNENTYGTAKIMIQ